MEVLTAGAFERSHKVRNILLQRHEWLPRVLIGRVAAPAHQDLPLIVIPHESAVGHADQSQQAAASTLTQLLALLSSGSSNASLNVVLAARVDCLEKRLLAADERLLRMEKRLLEEHRRTKEAYAYLRARLPRSEQRQRGSDRSATQTPLDDWYD